MDAVIKKLNEVITSVDERQFTHVLFLKGENGKVKSFFVNDDAFDGVNEDNNFNNVEGSFTDLKINEDVNATAKLSDGELTEVAALSELINRKDIAFTWTQDHSRYRA